MKKKVRSMFGLCLLMLGTANVGAQTPLSADEPKLACTVFNSWDGKSGETCTMMGVSSNGDYAIGWIESSITGVFWEREGNKVNQIFSPYEEETVDKYGDPAGTIPAGSFTLDVSDNGTIVGAFKDVNTVDKNNRVCFAPGYRTIDGTWKRVPILAQNLSGRDVSGKVVKISGDGTVMGGFIRAVDESGNETGNVPAIWKNGELQPTVPVADARYFELTAMSEDGTKWGGIKLDQMKTVMSSYTSVLYNGSKVIEIAGTKPDNTYTGQTFTTVNDISSNGKYACGYFYTCKRVDGKLATYVKGYRLDIATNNYTWIENFAPTVVMNDGTMFGRDRDDHNLLQTKAAIAMAYVNGEVKDFSTYIKETYKTTEGFDTLKISNITSVTEWKDGRCTMAAYVEEGGMEPARRPVILTIEEPKAPAEPKMAYAFNAGTYGDVGPNFVSFDLTNPVLNKIGDVQKGVSIGAGAQADNLYYATDFLGLEGAADPSLYTVDIKTGALTKVCKIEDIIISMSYDNSSKTMYAAVLNMGTFLGEIGTLDLTTGKITTAFKLDEVSLIGVACNKDGNLYALDSEGNFYSIDKTAKTVNKIGATGLTPDESTGQAFQFDPETGNLYWMCNGKDVRLAQIDLTTGKATELHTFAKTECELGMLALYIPGPTEVKVANLKAMKDAGANDELPYQITGDVLVTSVITSMTGGQTVYLEDETAAVAVTIGEVEYFEYQVGDKLKNVKGHYTYHNSFSFEFVSAEKVSSGNPIVPTKITVPELNKNFEENNAKYVEIQNAVLVSDEGGYTYYLVQENDSASIMPTAMEHMELMSSLVGKTVSFTGNVAFVDEDNNAVLNTISLIEYKEPIPAYAYKIGETMGFVSLDLSNPAVLNLLKEDVDGAITAGAGVNDKYYAATSQISGFGPTENGVLYSVNTVTGEVTSLGANITARMVDMAFDYTTATMFGISVSDRGESRLHKVDLTNGKLTSVGGVWENNRIWALACDKDGQLYGIGSDGDFYKINKEDATQTKVGAIGVDVLESNQSMAFDHKTEKLYWMCATEGDYSTLNVIDVATGAATEMYSYEEAANLMIALYIPCELKIQWPDQTFANLKAMKKAGASDANYIVSGEVLVTGVRASGEATIFYVEDANAAIAVNYTGETECPYKSGDKLKDLKGQLVVNGTTNSFDFESATVVSNGNEVVPTTLTIAEVNSGYPANEAKFIKIENAAAALSMLDRGPALTQGEDNKVLTNLDEMITKLYNKQVTVTGHIEAANREGVVMITLVSAVEYKDAISNAQANNFYCNNSEVVAEGAALIEIYDVAGRKVISSDREAVSVAGMNGMIVAKAYYVNGEVLTSKFVVK